jgi:hypothetical protein
VVWVPIRGDLSSLGFDLGRMRVHNTADLCSAEALTKTSAGRAPRTAVHRW